LSSQIPHRAPFDDDSGEARAALEPTGSFTRDHLARAVCARRIGLNRTTSKAIVDSVFDEILSTLAGGDDVKLSGFGAFLIRQKTERIGRNPKNGAPAVIEARRVVVFRAAVSLKAAINVRSRLPGVADDRQ
jgi:integration host factor subunit alpha